MKDVIYWCAERYKTLSLGCLAVLLLSFTFIKFLGKKQDGPFQDFLVSESIFQNWKSSHDPEQLLKLKAIIGRHHELHTKFDRQIAQHLLYANQDMESVEKALVSKEIQGKMQYYSLFSEHALLIGRGKWQEALFAASDLKKQMQEDPSFLGKERAFGPILFGFTLLRIANLQRMLGLKKEELLSWKELKAFVGWQDIPKVAQVYPDVGLHLERSYHENQFTLKDYISYREKALQSSL